MREASNECMGLARQRKVQSELPILVLSSEPDGTHLFVQEAAGRQRSELPTPTEIIGLERSGGVVSTRKIVPHEDRYRYDARSGPC